MIKELVAKNRSYRRFFQDEKIEDDTLKELVDLARLSSTGANLQGIKYIISNDEQKNQRIFPHLRWARYLKDWDGPEEGEKPSAYIVMLLDKSTSASCFCDHGIACQSILLGATEKGLGGCMFGSIDKEGLKQELQIPDRYETLLVLALGKPKEIVVLEEIAETGDIKYWRDKNGIHHVPKRKLEDIIIDL